MHHRRALLTCVYCDLRIEDGKLSDLASPALTKLHARCRFFAREDRRGCPQAGRPP